MRFKFDIQFFGGGDYKASLLPYRPNDNNVGGGGYYGPSSMPQGYNGMRQYTPGAWNNASGGGGQYPDLRQGMMQIMRQGK